MPNSFSLSAELLMVNDPMLTRRQIARGVLISTIGASFGLKFGSALVSDYLPLRRSTSPVLASTDHIPLIAKAQAEIRRDISQGLCQSNEARVVICPICCYGITVTSQTFS